MPSTFLMVMNTNFTPKPAFILCTFVLLLQLAACSGQRETEAPSMSVLPDVVTTETTTDFVGKMDSHFRVNLNGGAEYSIPVKVPPGTGKLAPKLSLLYNSKGGNGLLGMGWRLNGFSVIERTARTLAQDGIRGSVQYNADDKYALDGQRLININGSYGADGSIYHTEIESWSKIKSLGSCGSGPCSFQVNTKEGVLMEYGVSDDARIEALGREDVRVWALNQITDLHGNTLTVSYEAESEGSYFPTRIDYTGNENLDPQRSVVFAYEDRDDIQLTYQGSTSVEEQVRLTSISTFLGDDPVLEYRFTYQQGSATNRSQLISVQECAGAGGCLPATEFDWNTDAPDFDDPSQLSSNENWDLTIFPMDVNGDGLVDFSNIVNASGAGAPEITSYISDGSGFESQQTFTLEGSSGGGDLLPMDVNGDASVDFVYAINQSGVALQLDVFLAGDDGLTQAGHFDSDSISSGGGNLMSLDYDGDGKSDLVYASGMVYGEPLLVTPLLSTGDNFTADEELSFDDLTQGNLLAGDVNGDGMSDLIHTSCTNCGDEYALDVSVLLSNGTTFIESAEQQLAADGNGSLLPMDVNGDNLLDLVFSAWNSSEVELLIFFSNGVNFESGVSLSTGIETTQNPAQFTPMDFNGDGRMDLIYTEAPATTSPLTLNVFLSHGSGFMEGQVISFDSLNSGGQLLALDHNGDAKSDFLHVDIADNQVEDISIVSATQAMTDLVTGFNNGIGGSIEVTYKPLPDTTIYSKGDQAENGTLAASSLMNRVSGASFAANGSGTGTIGASFPVVLEDFPTYAVAEYTRSDGMGGDYSYKYFYSGARVDLSGRGWLGFNSQTTINEESDTQSDNYFQQLFPYTNIPDSSIVSRVSDGAMMTRTEFTHSTTYPVDGNTSVLDIELTNTRIEHYTFGEYDFTLGKDYEYDDYGNATLAADLGDIDLNHALYTHKTYDNDEDNWQLGYVTEKMETKDAAGDSVLSHIKFTYDNAQSTRDLLTEAQWDDQQNAWITMDYSYDPYGNRLSSTTYSGDTTSYTYDATYHAFLTAKTSPPNADGVSLQHSYGYDYGLGVKTSTTDPNEVTITKTLDGLGRVTESLGPNPDGDMVALTTSSRTQSNVGYIVETQTRRDWEGLTWGWTQKYKDGLGRTSSVQTLGDNGTAVSVVDKERDNKDRIVRQSMPYFSTDEPSGWRTKTFDSYGRVTRTVEPKGESDSTVTVITYDGKTATTQHANATVDEKTTAITIDYFKSKKRMISRVAEDGSLTQYTFDPLARPLSSIDPMGIVESLTYSTIGRKSEQRNASLGTTTYFPDDAARTRTVTQENDSTTIYTNDALGRLISRVAETQTVTYTYDLAENDNAMGRLASVSYGKDQDYSYAYDVYGNPATTTMTQDGNTYTTGRSYGPDKKPIQMQYPDGALLDYTFSPAGRLQDLDLDDGTGALNFVSYDSFTARGQSQTADYGNGVKAAYTYDPTGLLSTHTLTDGSDNAEVLLDHTFDFNYLKHITAISDVADSDFSQQFSYDDVGRLTTASGVYGTKEYSYDDSGNLILKDEVTYDISSDDYQVTSGFDSLGNTIFSASYDKVGNMIAKLGAAGSDSTMYQFDALNQLTTVSTGETLLYNFVYDHKGRRVKKVDLQNNITTRYVNSHFEITEFASDSVLQTKYIRTPGGLVASVSAQVSTNASAQNGASYAGIPSSGTLYFHKDQLNSTRITTNVDGVKEGKMIYLPYGDIYDAETEGSDNFRYKFGGKEMDESSGLYYYGARFYDPDLGRFISADTQHGGRLHQSDIHNRYAFGLNNPITYTDPTGHSVWSWAKDHSKQIAGVSIGSLEIAAGVTCIAVSEGGCAIGGAALIGAGMGGISYSLSHSQKNFNIYGFAAQDAIGGVAGAIGGATGNPVAGGILAGAFQGGAVQLENAVEKNGFGALTKKSTWEVAGENALASGVAGGIAGVGLYGGPLGGAVGGALGSIASQEIMNAFNHKSAGNINWTSVGISAAAGGIGGWAKEKEDTRKANLAAASGGSGGGDASAGSQDSGGSSSEDAAWEINPNLKDAWEINPNIGSQEEND